MKQRVFIKFVVVLFALLISFSLKSQTLVKKGNLKVIVTNIKSITGQIGFCLFKTSTDFPNHPEKAILAAFVKTSGNSVEYTFTNIEMGTYAVSAFHDEDSDRKINSNFIGIPKEGVGVSNNAKGHFGPPKFNDAKFDFNKSEQTITISLTYL